MAPVVYLVSGANRVNGIGFALVKALSARDNVVVFAGVRDPAAAKDLQALAKERSSKLHVVKLVSSDVESNAAAISLIKEKAGRLDVVIANAGINQSWTPAHNTDEEQLRNHFEVNVVGTFVLFKASLELLKASSSTPKFVMISSQAGGIERGASMPFDTAPYGMSKAAENFLARKLHHEHETDGLVVFPICPGAVDTDMGQDALKNDERFGAMPFKTTDDTAVYLLKVVDNATRDGHGGKFLNFDGEINPW